MRYYPEELMIMRLKGDLPRLPELNWVREMTPDQCIQKLKTLTGQDFGANPDAWDEWFEREKECWDAEDRNEDQRSGS